MKEANNDILRSVTILVAVSFVAIMGASPLFASVTYEDSLMAYWDFDESSGAVAADATGANNGTLVNDPTWTAGQYGNALSFDGVNNHVRINNAFHTPSGVTVAALVKGNDFNHNSRVFSNTEGGGYSISMDGNNNNLVGFWVNVDLPPKKWT